MRNLPKTTKLGNILQARGVLILLRLYFNQKAKGENLFKKSWRNPDTPQWQEGKYIPHISGTKHSPIPPWVS